VVVTVVVVTLPVNPPRAVPLIVVEPAVLPAVMTPTSRPNVALEPARMTALAVVVVPTAVFEDVRSIVMSLATIAGLFEASRRTALIALV
jgi:hypothetical protein